MIASKIAALLKEKQIIAIVSHVMPDGDSVGSMLALYTVLKRMGKDVDVYSSDPVPEKYAYLPGAQAIKTCCGQENKEYELLIVLDCGSMDRTGNCEWLENSSDISINIDHHGTNSLFANYNLVDTNASATGELIYQIIRLMGLDILKDEALCLYTAILTDTGSFRYSNTTSITHQIAGDLINTGIDFGAVYENVYRNYRFQDLKLLGKALNSIELYGDGKIGYMQVLKDDMEYNGSENTSDFIDYVRDIDSVEAAVFIKETSDGELKVSMRSKRIVDVKSICEKYGGGGHTRAAGCTVKEEIESFKERIISDIEDALKGEQN